MPAGPQPGGRNPPCRPAIARRKPCRPKAAPYTVPALAGTVPAAGSGGGTPGDYAGRATAPTFACRAGRMPHDTRRPPPPCRAVNRRHHTPCLQLQARAGPPDRVTLKRAASGIRAGQARHRFRASREARFSRPRPKPSAKRRTTSAGRHVTIRGIRREYMAAGKQGGRPRAFARGRSRPRRRTMRIR